MNVALFDYGAGNLHSLGKALERAGDADGARSLYRDGMETAVRVGDAHARAELEEALAVLGV